MIKLHGKHIVIDDKLLYLLLPKQLQNAGIGNGIAAGSEYAGDPDKQTGQQDKVQERGKESAGFQIKYTPYFR